MIPWKTILGMLAVLGILIGMAWLIHGAGEKAGYSGGQAAGYDQGQKAGFDAGKIAGDKEGYERGVADTQKLRDEETLRVLAEARAEAEKIRREGQERAEAEEERQRARVEFARTAYVTAMATVAADVRNLRERLRHAEARRALRLPDDPSRLPQATATPVGSSPTFTEWLVSPRGGEVILRVAETAEGINGGYIVCRATDPEGTVVQSEN